MSEWDWFDDYEWEASLAGNQDRVRLARLHREAYQFRESDPDHALVLLDEGRRLAEQLGEPWWALFYQQYRVHALLHFKQDYRDVLDLAVSNTLELRKPANASFPRRLMIHGDLVAAYLGIDPVGHADAIRKALTYLDAETPAEGDERYLLLGSERQFALELDQLDQAATITQRSMDLAAGDQDRGRAAHFQVFAWSGLCEIGWRKQDAELLEGAALTGEETARLVGHQVEAAGFRLWLALLHRRSGDELAARRLYRLAVGKLARLRMPPDPSYRDAECAYHEHASELEKALQVREAELAAIRDRGRLGYECDCLIKRCWLLRRLGRLTDSDVARTQAAAGRLRQPAVALARIDRTLRGEAP